MSAGSGSPLPGWEAGWKRAMAAPRAAPARISARNALTFIRSPGCSWNVGGRSSKSKAGIRPEKLSKKKTCTLAGMGETMHIY